MKNIQIREVIKIHNELRNTIITECDFLDDENLKILEETLYTVFSKFKIKKSINKENTVILEKFLNAKSLEGCSKATIAHYKRELNYFIENTNKNLLDVDNKDVLQYLGFQKEKGNTPVTLNNKRGVLNSLYQWLINEGYILTDPLKNIKKIRSPKKIKEPFTRKEIEILREELYKSTTKKTLFLRNIAIFEVLLSSGIRAGELCALNISDVNISECKMIINGKGNKQRMAYFNHKAQLAIENYLETRNDNMDPLFLSDRNAGESRLTVSALDRIISKLGKRANIKAHPHKFRHTFATDLLEKGMPLEQVKTTLGHVNIKTTQIYAKTSQKDIKMNHRNLIE